ncbi:unnamed protein product [Phytophthora fragariaefolia]|uniref:Unnamed protein product n=1 Tax=Phytophthora fragariaefolia TaxID=1490495 RepID=A0A9W6U9J7_9STRA|nr:unnamed protein product [Phytophthora fragariaefolia]
MQRYNISLRRTTTLTTLTDDLLTDRAVRYMKYLSPRLDALSLDHTVLMDETAVYFEDPRRQTIDATGARHVVLKSTGFASMRVTAVLAVSASGRKLPPLVVWKGDRQDGAVERVGNAYVTYQKRAWVDSQLLIKWLDTVFPSVLDAATPGKAVVWDSMRAHVSKAVKAQFANKNVEMFMIPGGLTPYVQAGDIGIYKSFKDRLFGIIDGWKSSDRVRTRKVATQAAFSGRCSAVGETAWKDVSDEVIRRSVAAAGISPCYQDWHISRHDVYGELFCRKWLSRDGESEDGDVEENILENLDEFTI